MNSVSLIGRLGRDPVAKDTESGRRVANFSLAVNADKKDDPPIWFSCSAFGKTAELVETYLKKGSQVGVVGRLSVDVWTDKEGVEQKTLKVNVDQVTFCGKKGETEEVTEPSAQSKPKAKAGAAVGAALTDEEIPF